MIMASTKTTSPAENATVVTTSTENASSTTNLSRTAWPTSHFEIEDYIYPVYSFEKVVYLYVWEVLVVAAVLVNILVISILLRKHLRNVTNVILSAIAVSDSLTGLVTLPTYIMVFMGGNTQPDFNFDTIDPSVHAANITEEGKNVTDTAYYFTDTAYMYYNVNVTNFSNIPFDQFDFPKPVSEPYFITKTTCDAFMISKYFLATSFHAVSAFLTLFLAVQRYAVVAYPLSHRAKLSIKKTVIVCVSIFVVAPILHLYHLINKKTVYGVCQWQLGRDGCGFDCIYLWLLSTIRHLIPCVVISIVTVLVIWKLRLGETELRRMNNETVSVRIKENRRATKVVVAIAIAFLTSEVPYGIFFLYNAIKKTVYGNHSTSLETNRLIHMCCEILLVLTFHVNFYIYTLYNKKFRKSLRNSFIKPFQSVAGKAGRQFSTKSSSSGQVTTQTSVPLETTDKQ